MKTHNPALHPIAAPGAAPGELFVIIMDNLRKILSNIDIELSGLSYTADGKNDFSVALLDVAIEHSKSIVVLIENSLYSSFYGLASPLIESLVRALWIQHCATDKQISYIREKDNFPLLLTTMLESVEKVKDWPDILS